MSTTLRQRVPLSWKRICQNNVQLTLGVLLFLVLSAGGLGSCAKNGLQEARALQADGNIAALEAATVKYHEVYVQALTALAGQYDALLLLAIKLAEAGQYNACIEQLEAARALKPEHAELYYYLGLCYTNLARHAVGATPPEKFVTEAKSAYERGLQYDDENHLLYYGQGILIGFVLEQPNTAISYLERAYELEPYDVNVLFALGNLYYQTQAFARAQKFYREIMDKTPRNSAKWQKAQTNLVQVQTQL